MDAPIATVTVYPQQARVTRRCQVTPADGTRIEITGLPLSLDAASVRVSGAGDALVTGVDVAYAQHAAPADATLRALVEEREAQQATIHAVEDDESASAARVELLAGVSRRSGNSFAKALADGSADPGRVEEVSEALTAQLATALKARRARTHELERLREDLAALDRKIESRTAQSTSDSSTIVVELESPAAAEIELSYVVPGAYWESGYDVRVHGTDVTVTSYGLVSQNTGEDWPECELTLSTARPANTVAIPELQPWYLDRRQPPPPQPKALAAPASLAYSAAPAGQDGFGSFVAEVEQGATAVTFRPARPVAIPSGAQGHRTTLAQLDLTAELDYVTAPTQGEEAYLRAKVVNTAEHTLRPGRAAVFHEAEFVGSTQLELWAPGEERELALGVDDRIRVERELVRRTASKATLSGQRRREAEYRTTVANHSPREAVVTVLDQAPVSRDDAITVRDLRTSPEPAEHTELGQLSWRLTIAAGASATVSLGYRVDVAKGVELTGWRE